MQEKLTYDDEISLMDIFDFLVDGWKTVFSIVFVGSSIGIVTSLNLPEQFEAKGTLSSGRFVGNDIESIQILTEKMKSPTYYDERLLVGCFVDGTKADLEAFPKLLNPRIEKNSNFLTISYRAQSRSRAVQCLNQVLTVVRNKQEILRASNLEIFLTQQAALRKKLTALTKSVAQLETDRATQFSFKNIEYSAAALITVRLQSQAQELLAVEEQISKNEIMLKSPNTQDAEFVTPIFASEQRVSPRRSQIVMLSAIGSLFFGVLILFFRKAIVSIKKQREERKSAAAINS
uniref:hypothetical protein n=1 Tax=Shewanella sp. TaxID=50422 RepID=UPI00404732C7